MRNVLIVDDEPWAREVVKSLGEWSRLGLAVAGEAEDGTTGLRLIEELRPHIVVTDMRMPGVDGIKLLQAMHERFPALKVIVMSGYDDFAYMRQAIQSRAVDYMLKPVDPVELNEALERCVRELEKQERTADASSRSPLALPGTAIGAIETKRMDKTRLAIEEVARYIDAHYPDPISLESISLRFYVSKEHLSRSFKAAFGENVSDRIARKRIDRAKDLLALPAMSTKDVARTVGYPELAYFHRIFKKHTGVTPGEFRIMARR
ncbi:MAG TPA: response regulator [Paenibacillus sp.]|nr:response regulator [Paenibacillus sp.]